MSETFVQAFGFSSEAEVAGYQSPYSFPHAHPGSVFIASTGTMWKPGCWERVVDMMMFHRLQGLHCWLEEIPDTLEAVPYAHIGKMRDNGTMKGRNSGLQNICLIDTDVLPEPSLLLELLKYDLPITAPLIDDGTGAAVGHPRCTPGQGLQRMRWVPQSFILFQANVFNGVPPGIFDQVTTEGVLFEAFWHYSHRAYMDTDVELKLATPATRSQGLIGVEKAEWLNKVDHARREPADRMPLNPNGPYIVDGIYAPYLLPREELSQYYDYLQAKSEPQLVTV